MTAADVSRDRNGEMVLLENVIAEAKKQKSVTVQLVLKEQGQLQWNTIPVAIDSIPEKIRIAGKNGVKVRIIVDNRAGVPIEFVEKIISKLDGASLANYLY